MFGFLRRKKAPEPFEAPAVEPTVHPLPYDAAPQSPTIEPTAPPEAFAASNPPATPITTASALDAGKAEQPAVPCVMASPHTAQEAAQEPVQEAIQENAAAFGESPHRDKPKSGFWQQLARSRASFTEGLGDLFLGKKAIDEELLDEIETRLLLADVGQTTTQSLIKALQQHISRKQIADANALFETLSQLMVERLQRVQKPRPAFIEHPHIMVVCGINGAGKTTTIGKLAYYFKNQGHKVMLAAGDTFRAAAVEQLMAWGARNQIPVIGEPGRSDSASVLFDAAQSAKARQIDVLIADTAGRLHTQGGLMDELKKLVRVISKSQPNAPHEIILVLDASIGQNALNQARLFHQAVGVTGLVVTKLDGTAKGGILFAIADELALPIYFIGVGEQLDDLRVFDPQSYVDALLDRQS
ncbi:MAG: signal recognition particle-docking protein FtsY [Halothiobacillus sp. 24-54-40]|jgi:fused signal recognition particle receptor|nr:MAG: signal recognition particle-docking protein FtsY [Halothiobacillus sp. 35-54-62]OYZ87819.1 MAG: signal recognition particle-docking protein FtsY [Halothiobacillus sp. 24-54-40]OZA80048.1 MAG: signal recognition particle-docking protein FtsY [Halothiobacillus sp. 39-53-45]HQS01989.1 signal recognition particle-docking protein FtsY [Halothiobacillus sp.]HQS28567.1 signal recognition particle-docking protein FtsY [Halothiobacillus sp.]